MHNSVKIIVVLFFALLASTSPVCVKETFAANTTTSTASQLIELQRLITELQQKLAALLATQLQPAAASTTEPLVVSNSVKAYTTSSDETAVFKSKFTITASDKDIYIANMPEYANRPMTDGFVNFSFSKDGLSMDGYKMESLYETSLTASVKNLGGLAGYSDGEPVYTYVYKIPARKSATFTLRVDYTPVETGDYLLHIEGPLTYSYNRTFHDGDDKTVSVKEFETNTVTIE